MKVRVLGLPGMKPHQKYHKNASWMGGNFEKRAPGRVYGAFLFFVIGKTTVKVLRFTKNHKTATKNA